MVKKLLARFFRENILLMLIFTILLLPTIAELFKPGFFLTQDGNYFLIRFGQFHIALRDGQIPPRWAPVLNQGFGYPVLIFYYPGAYMFGEIFYLLGFGLVNSFKIVMGLSMILGAAFMYLWQYHLWKSKIAAFTSAMVYTWAPYRFLDIYVRGSVGEAFIFVFLPLLFWSVKIGGGTGLVIGSTSLAGSLLSHNILGAIIIPIFLLFGASMSIFFKEKKYFVRALISAVLGVVASSFFWIPAIFEKSYTNLDSVRVNDFFEHFLYIKQLFISNPGFGPSKSGPNDSMSFEVGIVIWLSVLMALLFILFKRQLFDKIQRFYLLFSIFIFIMSVFMMTNYSDFVWRMARFYYFVQYPWRLLFLTTFFGSIVSSVVLVSLRNHRFRLIVSVVFVSLAIGSFSSFFAINKERQLADGFFFTNPSTTVVANEVNPKWMQRSPDNYAFVKIGSNEQIIVSESKVKSNYQEFKIKALGDTVLLNNTLYFPGWKAYVDGKEVEINYNNDFGQITFPVKKGEHDIVLRFGETKIRQVGDFATLGGLVLISILVLFRKKIKYV